jgi:hypothetical protein
MSGEIEMSKNSADLSGAKRTIPTQSLDGTYFPASLFLVEASAPRRITEEQIISLCQNYSICFSSVPQFLCEINCWSQQYGANRLFHSNGFCAVIRRIPNHRDSCHQSRTPIWKRPPRHHCAASEFRLFGCSLGHL